MSAPANPKVYCQGVVSAAPVPQRLTIPLEGLLKYALLNAGWKRCILVPPEAPAPISPVDNISKEEVSTWSRTAVVPSSAAATKVVPLVMSTIGGATSWGLVPFPIGSVANACGLSVGIW